MDLNEHIAIVPDFPEPGVRFKDLTPLLAHGDAFAHTIDKLCEWAIHIGAEVVVGPEARGFIFGAPVSSQCGIGFVPVRKPGKLPRKTLEHAYDLEYGSNILCLHTDAIHRGQRVIIVDDVLATGGTVAATAHLIEELGGVIAGCAFILEVPELEGRKRLEKYPVQILLSEDAWDEMKQAHGERA